MDPRPPMWASETALIRRLEAEWRVLARSRWLRSRLQAWSAEDDRLAFGDGDQLVAAAQRRNVSSWAQRDQALAALLERADEDPVARRVALQVVLPGVKSLIDGIRGWDVEERAAQLAPMTLDPSLQVLSDREELDLRDETTDVVVTGQLFQRLLIDTERLEYLELSIASIFGTERLSKPGSCHHPEHGIPDELLEGFGELADLPAADEVHTRRTDVTAPPVSLGSSHQRRPAQATAPA